MRSGNNPSVLARFAGRDACALQSSASSVQSFHENKMLVLGIETSCDETAAAVIRDGREIVSSVISSQIKTHARFGGVVPELASREHLDKIVPIVEEAFTRAKLTQDDIEGIAVTVGPGLVGSFLVGVSYAKA